jgi:hypothetical protein
VSLNAFFREALDNPPPGPVVTGDSAVIAGPLSYPVMNHVTNMCFFTDIVNSPNPIILNQCIPMSTTIPISIIASNDVQESRVGWHLSQEVCLSQQQPDEDEQDEMVMTGSYCNAYATFTAHAAKLSNLLQGRPHLVEKYSRVMAQAYAAAVTDIKEEPDVNVPGPPSSHNGTISLNLETSRSQKKPKRLGCY